MPVREAVVPGVRSSVSESQDRKSRSENLNEHLASEAEFLGEALLTATAELIAQSPDLAFMAGESSVVTNREQEQRR